MVAQPHFSRGRGMVDFAEYPNACPLIRAKGNYLGDGKIFEEMGIFAGWAEGIFERISHHLA